MALPTQEDLDRIGLRFLTVEMSPRRTRIMHHDRSAQACRQKNLERFIHYLSLRGITGSKLNNVTDIQENVKNLKKVSASPVAVGFGVATPEDAAQVSRMADGVIVGSAIVKRIASHRQDSAMLRQVAEFVRSLKAAMTPA